MSKEITREEALECFSKIYGNAHSSDTYYLQEEFSILEQYINQECVNHVLPNTDIEEAFGRLYSEVKNIEGSFGYRSDLDKIKSKLTSQAQEIERKDEEIGKINMTLDLYEARDNQYKELVERLTNMSKIEFDTKSWLIYDELKSLNKGE